MSTSPGAKFSAGGFKDLGTALEGIVKKATAATTAIEKLFASPALSEDSLNQVAKDLNDVALAFNAIENSATGAARAIGKAIRGIKVARKNGVRMGGGGGGGGDGGGGAAGAAPDPTDGPWKANWVSSLDAVMSASKYMSRRAAESAKQQSALDKLTYRLRNKIATTEARSAAVASKEQAALDKLTYRLRKNIAKAEAKQAEERAKRPSLMQRGVDNLHNMAFNRFKSLMAFRTLVGGADATLQKTFGRSAGMLGLSRFGPGALGVLGKYRAFQKPFPGSDRNIFSLGDTTAIAQNVVFAAGEYLETSFSALTGSALAVNKAFSGIVTGAVGAFAPFLGSLLGSVSDLLIGTLETLNAAIAGVIGSFTRLGAAMVGFITRAVEAASNLTEAVNAANVIAGPRAAGDMLKYATTLQKEYGLSVTDAMKAMGRMAGMMRNLGDFSQDEAGFAASRLYRYAVDIGSVVNKSAEEVGIAMMSGFAGRLTPLRRFMIGMSAPQLDAMAKSRGITKPGVRTDYEARIRQFVEEFARQGGLFVGDLERTRYEFANQRRKLLGQFEALFVSVGKIFEPFAKVVLFAANDLMTALLDFIDPLANPKVNSVLGTGEITVASRLSQYLDPFVDGMLRARNFILSLADAAWNARMTIVDYASSLGKAFLAVTSGVVNYSVNVLRLTAGLVESIGGLLPMIKSFGTSLLGLSDWIDRNILGGTGTGSTPEQTKQLYQQLTESLRAQQEWAKINSGNAVGRFALQQSDRIRGALAEMAPFVDASRAVRGYGGVQYKGIPRDVYNRLADAAGLKPEAGISTIFDNIDVNFGAVGKQLSDLVASMDIAPVDPAERAAWKSRLQGAISTPGVVAPRPDMSAGRLVQYFDPAAFRNAIQERDISGAALRTADATERTVELLEFLTESNKTFPYPMKPLVPIAQ